MDAFADPVNAFVPHGRLTRSEGRGLTVAVKDLFDWRGVPTGAGNPDWLATHPVPSDDAAVLTVLLRAGFTLHGKTVTDELAYSIHGDNEYYGTPLNSAAPGRVPGGSSSGSAAAVAAGLVDAALGTDTGGSVRVPAAYCGIYGLRTTHGAVDRSGLVPLAPSFDTIGWFGRSASTVAALAGVLLPRSESRLTGVATLALPGIADPETLAQTARLAERLGTPFDLAPLIQSYGGLDALRRVYVTIQGREAWQTHGSWIEARRPRFSRAIALRFQAASRVSEEEAAAAREVLARFRQDLRSALGPAVLVLPATEGPAPMLNETPETVDLIRQRTMGLTCLAGLAGLPQLTVPFVGNGLPRGVGLLGPAGSDHSLISLAEELA